MSSGGASYECVGNQLSDTKQRPLDGNNIIHPAYTSNNHIRWPKTSQSQRQCVSVQYRVGVGEDQT